MAAHVGADRATVVTISVHDTAEAGTASTQSMGDALQRASAAAPTAQPGEVPPTPVEQRAVALRYGERLDPQLLAGANGVVIAGGITPEYVAACAPAAETIRELIGSGVPYLGFSAGASIAAERALVGGWRIGDVAVGRERVSEGIDEVTVTQGLGLIDLTVEAHTAQWGTLSRLIAATEAGLTDAGLGIDEDTALVVGTGALVVLGAGSVWKVRRTETGVHVSTMGAA